jgi:tRNA A-37 threonylcarbamoyl transferase component Bud32
MVGSSIGSFQIVSVLGQGGMGIVYVGEHRRIARRVAIKVLHPHLSNDPAIVERFFTEARATSVIRHPGLVEISDCDLLPDGSAYIVMELLEGESLGNHLASHGRLAVPRALEVARAVADTLAAAHDKGIVHRDLKPDNVFVLAPAAASITPIKVLDFGIAKLMDAHGAAHKTRTGMMLGTPLYMSPEQCRGARTVDHRTDIYALGCLLYEMLSGHPPFTSQGFGELIQAHLLQAPRSLRVVAPAAGVPEVLDELVALMLAKSPDDRPQTMREVVTALDAIGAGGAPRATSVRRAATAPVVTTTPSVAAMPAVAPAAPRRPASDVETTLGSATWEATEAPKPRSQSGIWAAVVVVAIAGGGAAIWRVTHQGGGGGGAVQTPPPVAVATPAPQVEPPPPVAAPPPPVAPAPPAEEPSPPPGGEGRGPNAAAPEKVTVTITSKPSGADVCLASNGALIGKTQLTWSLSADRAAHVTHLLIRKRGYRGREITVSGDRDLKKMITLDKLGPDDMEDVDNCRAK